MILFNPKIPGNFSATLNIKHSDGEIKCMVFSEAFYADLRMVELDGKPLVKEEMAKKNEVIFESAIQKERNLNFLKCDYDKSYQKTVTFKNFTNQTLRFEWIEVQKANKLKSKRLIEELEDLQKTLEKGKENTSMFPQKKNFGSPLSWHNKSHFLMSKGKNNGRRVLGKNQVEHEQNLHNLVQRGVPIGAFQLAVQNVLKRNPQKRRP